MKRNDVLRTLVRFRDLKQDEFGIIHKSNGSGLWGCGMRSAIITLILMQK